MIIPVTAIELGAMIFMIVKIEIDNGASCVPLMLMPAAIHYASKSSNLMGPHWRYVCRLNLEVKYAHEIFAEAKRNDCRIDRPEDKINHSPREKTSGHRGANTRPDRHKLLRRGESYIQVRDERTYGLQRSIAFYKVARRTPLCPC